MLPLCGGKQLTSAPLRVLIVDWLRLSKSSTLYVKWISKGMTNMCPMKYLAVFAAFHETTAPDPFAWHHIINDSLLKHGRSAQTLFCDELKVTFHQWYFHLSQSAKFGSKRCNLIEWHANCARYSAGRNVFLQTMRHLWDSQSMNFAKHGINWLSLMSIPFDCSSLPSCCFQLEINFDDFNENPCPRDWTFT